jgi:hypothetical protein
MTTEITKLNTAVVALSSETVASLVLKGDLSGLQPQEKVAYYRAVCERVGLDPAMQPFKLLKLNGKEVMYADKGATQQLSQLHKISHDIVKKETIGDVYVVTVKASMPDGRYTVEDGAVTIANQKGEALANSLMKAVTKSKRRAVLALCGLGMLDETEVETIQGAVPVETPKVADGPTPAQAKVLQQLGEPTAYDKAKAFIQGATQKAQLVSATKAVEAHVTKGHMSLDQANELTALIDLKEMELSDKKAKKVPA